MTTMRRPAWRVRCRGDDGVGGPGSFGRRGVFDALGSGRSGQPRAEGVRDGAFDGEVLQVAADDEAAGVRPPQGLVPGGQVVTPQPGHRRLIPGAQPPVGRTVGVDDAREGAVRAAARVGHGLAQGR